MPFALAAQHSILRKLASITVCALGSSPARVALANANALASPASLGFAPSHARCIDGRGFALRKVNP
jgi:hypothetical protein